MYSHGLYCCWHLPDFFSKRFGGSKTITCIAAWMIVIFLFHTLSFQGFAACGKLFASLSDIDCQFYSNMVTSAAIIVCIVHWGLLLQQVAKLILYKVHC